MYDEGFPEQYKIFIEHAVNMARDILEQGNKLPTMALVGNLETEDIFPLALDTESNASKSASARQLGYLAETCNADFILMITEAWVLPTNKAKDFEQVIEKYGSIGASPYRVDAVSFSLETHEGIWMGICHIRRKGPSKKKRTIDKPRFQYFREAKGRFVDLLPNKAQTNKSLH